MTNKETTSKFLSDNSTAHKFSDDGVSVFVKVIMGYPRKRILCGKNDGGMVYMHLVEKKYQYPCEVEYKINNSPKP